MFQSPQISMAFTIFIFNGKCYQNQFKEGRLYLESELKSAVYHGGEVVVAGAWE